MTEKDKEINELRREVARLRKALEEAEPKHGRWEIIYYDNEPKFAYCSECDQKLIFTKEFEQIPNFCPNCGATMEGGTHETD